MGRKGGGKKEKEAAEAWLWDLESKRGHHGWRGDPWKGVRTSQHRDGVGKRKPSCGRG